MGAVRAATLCFFVYVVFEGALRKWVLPAYSNELFVLKDLILAAGLFALIAHGRMNGRYLKAGDVALWAAWIVLVAGYAMLDGFSVETLIGMRYYLAPLPLIVLVPAILRDFEDLRRLARYFLWITLVIGALGVLQYLSPVDSPLNKYAWRAEAGTDVASFGVTADDGLLPDEERARITGSFSYISPYASFLMTTWLLAWVVALRGRCGERQFAGIALVVILANLVMTGSRGPVLISLLASLPFALAALREAQTRALQYVPLALLLGSLLFASMGLLEPFAGLLARAEHAGDTDIRIIGTLAGPVSTVAAMDALGQGIGSSFAGFEQFGYVASAQTIFDEVFHDRVGMELGLPGYALALVVKITMVVKAARLALRGRHSGIRHWALAALCCQAGYVWQIPVYNSVAAIFYFSSIGVVYWLQVQDDRVRLRRALPTSRHALRAPLG